jgi:TPR repeat protein
MGIVVPTENLRGHGLQHQTGLLSSLHPITRGADVNALVANAASRYSSLRDVAVKSAERGQIMVCKYPSNRSYFELAVYVLAHDALDLRIADAQFCLGVLHWKGTGVKCNFDRAVEFYNMAADQVRIEAMIG